MIKKMIIAACFFLTGNIALAQNVFQVKDISQPNDVYSSVDDEAAVIVKCHKTIPLSFSSSMDKSVVPFRTELQGNDSVYYIAFPTGNRYRGRELTISSFGYTPAAIPLELQPKQLLTFQVIDPNALVDAGCYRGHRNKGIEEIKNSNYEEARNQFMVARECSDCDTVENKNNIALADSLIYFRQKGDEAYKLLDYVTAGEFYSKIIALNVSDTYAVNRNTLCVQNYIEECANVFTKAEYYYTEKEYDKAKELYEKVVERECRNSALAIERLNKLSSLELAKKDHSRVLTYEYRQDVPIGFSYGKYNMRKVGGFFQLDLNPDVFKAIRRECLYGDEKFPEVNVAFGWTVKICNPIWIHFGPGFTGKMYYGTYIDKKYPKKGFGKEEWGYLEASKMGYESYPGTKDLESIPEKNKDAWTHTNLAAAISPVIGITAKYSYFAIRMTYQYRWPIEKELKDFIGANRFSVGVGVSF